MQYRNVSDLEVVMLEIEEPTAVKYGTWSVDLYCLVDITLLQATRRDRCGYGDLLIASLVAGRCAHSDLLNTSLADGHADKCTHGDLLIASLVVLLVPKGLSLLLFGPGCSGLTD